MKSSYTEPKISFRTTTWLDRLLSEAGHALRTVTSHPDQPKQPSPGGDFPETTLSDKDSQLIQGLMRINHTGEIAAQALYRGQAFVAENREQEQALLMAADEEQDHLIWCAQRLEELDSHVSCLAPFWYGGSFLIGVSAGLAGDDWSLGFVEETEIQVSAHLDDHLGRIPESDERSRAILERMRADEERHAEKARAAGARELPTPVKKIMTGIANLMRFVSHRI